MRYIKARHACRKTPKSCGNRPGSNRRAKPARKPRDHYTTQSCGRSIAYGCEAAWPHPELTRLRKSQLSNSQNQELREWNARHRWSPSHQAETGDAARANEAMYAFIGGLKLLWLVFNAVPFVALLLMS